LSTKKRFTTMTPVRRFGDVDLGAIEERFKNENMQLLLNNLKTFSPFSMSLIPGVCLVTGVGFSGVC
jgi:hypothetical protein